MTVVLRAADDPAVYGGKAVQLGAALRAGLPVPDGLALGWPDVEDVASGRLSLDGVQFPDLCSVRSSAVGEDSAEASFAGAHLTMLGVRGCDAITDAVSAVRASAHEPAALAYRATLGLPGTPRMAVVVQELVDAEVAGVMFTRNPVTGADECVVEASWGLGEAVVDSLVTPDHWTLDRDGQPTVFRAGEKDVAVRRTDTGVAEEPVEGELVTDPCLDATQLASLRGLADACDRVWGGVGHDIEFAFAGGQLYLLQRRPITRG